MGARCHWAQRNRPLSGGFGMLWTTLALNVYDGSTKAFWQLIVGSWGGGSGPRLAELREQACNTDQGDLVMDIRLTESPLCLLNICVECNGSSWLSPTMADSVLKKSAKCCYCILCSPQCLIKSHISNFRHVVSAQTEWLRLKNKQSNRPNCSSANESHLQNRPKACRR